MATSKISSEARAYLASIGRKGGKVKSEKKLAQVASISSKGGKTVTPKKLAAIRAMTAARVARQEQQRAKNRTRRTQGAPWPD